MARNKRKTKNEFRYNYSTKHMNYIFEEDGSDYHSLGLTTKNRYYDYNKKKWRKNMPLWFNPKKNDKRKSYIRYGVISQNKKTFNSKVDKRFDFSEPDRLNVKSKIRNYKNRRKKS